MSSLGELESNNRNITWQIGLLTRFAQSLYPHYPIKGLWCLHEFLYRLLPKYRGVVRLPDGICIYLDPSRSGLEKWMFYSGIFEPTLSRLLQQYAPVDGYCLDVGAHFGTHTLRLARKVGLQGKVISFEANPTTAQELNSNVVRNGFQNVEIIQKAVHDCSGKVIPLYVSSPGTTSILIRDDVSYKEIVQVETISIDDFMQGYKRLDLIKIDIEGNDFNAMVGARETIKKFLPFICFEWSWDSSWQVAQESFDFLDELKYTLEVITNDEVLYPFPVASREDFLNRLKSSHSNFNIVCYHPKR